MGLDIQSETFLADFDMQSATVGQVGYGFIGRAVAELFRPHCKVLIKDTGPAGSGLQTLDQLVAECEVIFVAVPTPMKSTGECHTGIVEALLQDIQNSAARQERDLGAFIVVVKSTVPPGFTARMQERLGLRILFSPEFLTEANAVDDFRTTNRVILGGLPEDATVVFKYFEGVWPDRMIETYVDHPDCRVVIIHCDPTVAEMVKLSANAHLASRVLISNEVSLVCQKLGVNYAHVASLSQLDQRVGSSHMSVPGPDGKRGFSGSCFPKDIRNLDYIATQLGEPDNIFADIFNRNLFFRQDRDWETLTGRAVLHDDDGKNG